MRSLPASTLSWLLMGLSMTGLALSGCDDTPDDGMAPILLPDGEPMADAEPMPDAEPVDMAIPPLPAAAQWCRFVMPATADETPTALQWSAAHAFARLFGPHADGGGMDDHLAAALAADDPVAEYARQVPFACAVDAVTAAALPAARVELRDGVAWVQPGEGAVEVPAEARAIVLDLTGLPEHPELWDALARASAAVFAAPIPRAGTVRTFHGLAFAAARSDRVYNDATALIDLDPWPGQAPARPVAVVVEATQPALVADLAGSARVVGAAALVGAPVFASVIESRTLPVGERGLAIRWIRRVDDLGAPLPDLIAPDGYDALALLDRSPTLAPVIGEVQRSDFGPLGFEVPIADYDAVRHRAGLIISHGLLRWFHPYAAEFEAALDARLLELLDALAAHPAPDRALAFAQVDGLLAALPDGTASALDPQTDYARMLPLVVDFEPDWTPFVQRSPIAELVPGAIIDAIDGVPAADWFAAMAPRIAAPNTRYRYLAAVHRLMTGGASATLDLTDPDGTARTVELTPGAYDLTYTSAPWLHETGTLDAWGAPEVLYIALARDVNPDSEQAVDAALAAYPEAEAIVLDVRDRVAGNTYFAATHLVGARGLSSPIFDVPEWVGPDRADVGRTQYHNIAGPPSAFAGPISVLVDPRSVGGAETLITMLAPLEQVRFVGRASSGADGNPTGVWLPGGVGVAFVGMDMRMPDDSVFNGVGIAPDVQVDGDAAAVAAGRDLALEAAIEELRGR